VNGDTLGGGNRRRHVLSRGTQTLDVELDRFANKGESLIAGLAAATQPGRSGTYAAKPLSLFSTTTTYSAFISSAPPV